MGAPLVESQLFFNTSVVVPNIAYLRVLIAICMRLHRRIHDCMRHDDSADSDLEVRQRHTIPSVDCVIMRKRLLYLRRVMTHRPPTLLALLHCRVNSRLLPWVTLITEDLQYVRDWVMPHLPDPSVNPESWQSTILDASWVEVVKCVFFVTSVLDKVGSPDQVPEHARTFVCSICGTRPAFSSHRALASHQRAKHGQRNPVRCFVGSGVCPVCSSDYQDRLRCIAHLSDFRRPSCRDRLLSGEFAPLPPEIVAKLDAIDAELRKKAHRAGRTHFIGKVPARKVDGAIVGRIAASGYD